MASLRVLPIDRTATLRLNETGVPLRRNAWSRRPLALAASMTGDTAGFALKVIWRRSAAMRDSSRRRPSPSHSELIDLRKSAESVFVRHSPGELHAAHA